MLMALVDDVQVCDTVIWDILWRRVVSDALMMAVYSSDDED
jgi:hypothetical protein